MSEFIYGMSLVIGVGVVIMFLTILIYPWLAFYLDRYIDWVEEKTRKY